ncbi:MAG: hypothetical protein V3W41_06825 [Planctomycetota bacterium]
MLVPLNRLLRGLSLAMLALSLMACGTVEAEVEGAGENPEEVLSDEELQAAVEESDRINRRRYEEIEAIIAEGDLKGAIAMIDEMSVEEGLDPKWRSRFQVLKIRAKRDLAQTKLLRGIIRLNRYRFAIGDIIKGEVVLENISGREVFIPATSEVQSGDGRGALATGTFFHRKVTYHEFVPSNTVIMETDTANIRVDEDIRLAPGESFRIPIELDTGMRNKGGRMLRSYVFDCTLHPAEIMVGDEMFNVSLPFRSAEARVYPLNAEHLAIEPLDKVKESFRRRTPTHLHLAASLVGVDEMENLYGFFYLKLRDPKTPDYMELAIMTCLRICSGDSGPENKESWLAWLRKRGL